MLLNFYACPTLCESMQTVMGPLIAAFSRLKLDNDVVQDNEEVIKDKTEILSTSNKSSSLERIKNVVRRMQSELFYPLEHYQQSNKYLDLTMPVLAAQITPRPQTLTNNSSSALKANP